MHDGTADADQQKRAMQWILSKACNIGGLPWDKTDRDTAFACGRQFVGKEIGRLLICDINSLRGETNGRRNT